MTATPARRIVAVVVLAAIGLEGCALHGLSFVQDDRVQIVQPHGSGEFTLPIEVSWTSSDWDGQFLVLFDRSPMRPGQTLDALVPETDPCRADAKCPDADWLRDRDIYLTEARSILVDDLPDRRSSSRSKDRHEFVIVLLDADGRRLGESAFGGEFLVDRKDS